MKMIKTFTKIAVGLVAAVGLCAEAQQTNLFTNTTANMPFYSQSNNFAIFGQQILTGDAIVNGTNYYTNSTPTNYANTNVLVNNGIMGVSQSLNTFLSITAQLTNGAIGAGTNLGLNAYIDQSAGFGDWIPFTNITASLYASGPPGYTNASGQSLTGGVNVNVGGSLLLRINRIVFTNNAALTTNGVNLVNMQYSCKSKL